MKKISNKKNFIASILIVLGLIMFLTGILLEFSNFPWAKLISSITQSEDYIQEKPDITSEKEPNTEVEILPGETTISNQIQSPYPIIGTLTIPSLDVSANLIEGSEKQLEYGVGHVKGTDAVGSKGNCVIAGHRKAPFRYLNMLGTGDQIIIEINKTEYIYTAYNKFTVLPEDIWVLNDIKNKKYALTLITCTPYPLFTKRLIVRAELTSIDGISPNDYYSK